jgi:sugar porter (SP) family MFS transporter
MRAYLIRSCAVGALGGLLFGFDTAVIAGTTHSLVQSFHLTPAQLGITVSSALWGTVLSALFSGIPGEKFGARESLRATAIIYVISAIGCAIAWDWYSLLFFRFIGGLGIGASSVLGPVYIAELAPAMWRGRLVGMFQINVVLGILLAYLSNYLIGLQALGSSEWRWQIGVSAIPAALFLLMLFFIPRSPRWLVAKGELQEARDVLTASGEADPQREVQEIVDSIGRENLNETVPLFTRKHLKPILLATSIGAFNQLSGINAILYYLNDIFAQAGFNRVSSDQQAVLIGATNLFFTLFAMSIIDKFGRKPLLAIGTVGTATCLFGVASIFLSHSHSELLIWLLMGYIGFFAISQGAVIWVYISEIFPTPVRARGQSLGSSAHWIMNAFISGIFPVMTIASNSLPFFVFGSMMLLQFVLVITLYPETKQASLEELQERLGTG